MKKTDDTHLTMGIVKLGYVEVVLPLADALELMRCFSNVERHRTKWIESKNVSYLGGDAPTLQLTIMSGTEYMTAKLNGEYPND